MFHVLELKRVSQTYALEDHETRSSVFFTRAFLDFIVDGRSLKEHLDLRERFAFADTRDHDRIILQQMVGVLGWFRPSVTRRYLRNFKRFRPALKDSREELYVCHLCGDMGCGSITAQMLMTEQAVIWKNFAYQTTEEKWEPLQDSPEFHFEKASYFSGFYGLSSQLLKSEGSV